MYVYIDVYIYMEEPGLRLIRGRGACIFALGTFLGGPSLGPNKGPSLGPLLGPSLPSEARHARIEVTRFVAANCTYANSIPHMTQTKARTQNRLIPTHNTD